MLPRLARETGPLPAIYAAHQCACQCDIGKEQVVGKAMGRPDQAHGFELVRRGSVVLAPDANKGNERYDPELRRPWERAFEEKEDQRCCCTAPGGSWGPGRWRPGHDVTHGVGFLCQQPLVDPDQIGTIGHSLGSDTTTVYGASKRLCQRGCAGAGVLRVEGWSAWEGVWGCLAGFVGA